MLFLFALLLVQAPAPGAPDPAYANLDRAYQALRAKDLDAAEAEFRRAAQVSPQRPDIHKELAYLYVRMGETEKAVAERETIRKLAPQDGENLMALGYLYFETRLEHMGVEMFELASRHPDREVRESAAEALAGVRRQYEPQIRRWKRLVEADPKNESARWELAQLYFKVRELREAIEQVLAFRRLRPDDLASLNELGRLYRLVGDEQTARAYFVLAWRSRDPRVREFGREGLGPGYPSVADFRRALELDPRNNSLRRDLAYLYLNLQQPRQAVAEFERIIAQEPEDWQSVAQLAMLYVDAGQGARARPLLERVMQRAHPDLARKAAETLLRIGGADQKEKERLEQMRGGYTALSANNLRAAAEMFEGAWRIDPACAAVPLQLGWIYNMLHQDAVAVQWFKLAGNSADPYVAATARRAIRNLEMGLRRVVYTFWSNPVISSRWQDVFGYAQWKAELKIKKLPFRPYVSLRFNGDARTRSQDPAALFYSDGGWTAGIGVFAQPRKDLYLWGEVGNTLSYYRRPVPGTDRLYPDYRGGATWFRTFGPMLYTDLPGYRRFTELAVASIFISRYSNDVFNYVQTRTGLHLPRVGLMNSQAYVAVNFVKDVRDLYWANFLEAGPGFTFGFRNFPQMQTSVGLYRGSYTRNLYNPRRPNFWDLRLNIWYARSF